MSTLGDRIKQASDKIGGLDNLIEVSSIKRRTLYDYKSNKTEPKISTLAEIAEKTGVTLEWLVYGDQGEPALREIHVREAALSDIRKYIQTIAATFWEQAPRDTKSEEFAAQFIKIFDHLLKQDGIDEKSLPNVIKFAAAELKKENGKGEK